MAFSAALRRAASSAAPLAIRAVGGSRLSNHSALLRSLPSAPLARFSSLAKIPASDADLLRVIDSEIKCAKECDDHDRVEEIPKGFPFKIADDKGSNTITLIREYDSESIRVVVSMPSLVTGEEPEDDREAGDGDEDDDNEKSCQSSIPLSVNISKDAISYGTDENPHGHSLEFSCTAYPDNITIDSMSVVENRDSGDEEMIAYEGPDFDDLDENLQKALHKYLEIRGISPITTNFLHEYMINKDSREYLNWLNRLKAFVQKSNLSS